MADAGDNGNVVAVLLDYAEANNGKAFVSLLKQYVGIAKNSLALIKATKSDMEKTAWRSRMERGLVDFALANPEVSGSGASPIETEAELKNCYKICQNTLEIANRACIEVAIKYFDLFFARTDYWGRTAKDKGVPFNSRLLNKADDIAETLFLLAPPVADSYLERLYKVTNAIPNLAIYLPLFKHTLPPSTQIFLYAAGEKLPDVEKALNKLSMPHFFKGLDAISPSKRVDAKKIFMDMLLSSDAVLDGYYESIIAQLKKSTKLNLLTFLKNKSTEFSVLYDFVDKSIQPPLIDIAKHTLEGSLDSLVIYYALGKSDGFLQKQEELFKANADSLKAIGYLMLSAGSSSEETAKQLIERIPFIEQMQILTEDGTTVPLHKKIYWAAVHGKKYPSEQALEAILNMDSAQLTELFAPKKEKRQENENSSIAVKPAQPRYEESIRNSIISEATKGVALFSYTDTIAKKQAERIKAGGSLAVYYAGITNKTLETIKRPVDNSFFEKNFGLYIINYEPSADSDDLVLLVAELIERKNGLKPNFLLISNETFKNQFVIKLAEFGELPPIMHYNNPAANGYLNISSIKLEELLQAAQPLGVSCMSRTLH